MRQWTLEDELYILALSAPEAYKHRIRVLAFECHLSASEAYRQLRQQDLEEARREREYTHAP